MEGRELVPGDREGGGRARLELHVLESHDPALAISQAAERLGADVICLGTRRLGATAALLGSTAREVLTKTRRPVLFVQAGERT